VVTSPFPDFLVFHLGRLLVAEPDSPDIRHFFVSIMVFDSALELSLAALVFFLAGRLLTDSASEAFLAFAPKFARWCWSVCVCLRMMTQLHPWVPSTPS
jgi:hypothetical protein